jgi:hypothetical protein
MKKYQHHQGMCYGIKPGIKRKPVTITVKPLKVTTHGTEKSQDGGKVFAAVLLVLFGAFAIAMLVIGGKP